MKCANEILERWKFVDESKTKCGNRFEDETARKFARSIILIFDFKFWLLIKYTDARIPTLFRIFFAGDTTVTTLAPLSLTGWIVCGCRMNHPRMNHGLINSYSSLVPLHSRVSRENHCISLCSQQSLRVLTRGR